MWISIAIFVCVLVFIRTAFEFANRLVTLKKYIRCLEMGNIIDPMLEEKYNRLGEEFLKLEIRFHALQEGMKGTIGTQQPFFAPDIPQKDQKKDISKRISKLEQDCSQIGENTFPFEDKQRVQRFIDNFEHTFSRNRQKGEQIIQALKPHALRLLNITNKKVGYPFLTQNINQLKPKLEQLFEIIEKVILQHLREDKETIGIIESLADYWIDDGNGNVRYAWEQLPDNLKRYIESIPRLQQAWQWVINPEQ